MLRDAAVSIIAQRLGNRTDLNDQIIAEMQFAQEALETEDYKPHFLLSEFADTTTTIGEERLAVPSNFIQEYDEGTLWYYDTTGATPVWTPLRKRAVEDIKNAGLAEGPPQYYSIGNGYFRLGPVPDAEYSIKMLYYKRDTVLTSNIENGWLKYAPRLLIARTGLDVATFIRDPQLVQIFGQLYTDARAKFIANEEGRKHANMDYRMEYN